jgi:transposase
MHINNNQREKLVAMVIYGNLSLSKACQQLNIKYTTGRSIIKVYKREGRVYRSGTHNNGPNVAAEPVEQAAPSSGTSDATSGILVSHQTQIINQKAQSSLSLLLTMQQLLNQSQ